MLEEILVSSSFLTERGLIVVLTDTGIMSERKKHMLVIAIERGLQQIKYLSIPPLPMPRKCMSEPRHFDCDHCTLTNELPGVLQISLQ